MRTLLILVLGLALALRLPGLGSSLWIDEVDTLIHCVRLPVADLLTTYPSENQHPLYSLLAHAAIAAFGESETTLRLPAVLLGVAGVLALWRLGRQALDERTALLAALLLAVSCHPVWFAQNARGYTGLLLFTLLATSELLALLAPSREGGAPRGAFARYAVWCALAAFTHLTAVFAFAGHALVWAWLAARGRAGWRPAAAMALGAALALLCYAPMLGDVVRAFTARAAEVDVRVVKVASWTDPGWALAQVAGALGPGIAPRIALAGGALLALIGLASLWRRARLLVLLHLAPVPLALAFLLLLERHLYPRFFFFEAGFAALALAQGAQVAGAWLARRIRAGDDRLAVRLGVAAALVVCAGSAATLTKVYAHPKQDFVGARDWVEAHAAPGDARVAVGPAKLALPGHYAPHWSIAENEGELERIRAGAPRTWIVYVLPEQLEAARPDLAAAIERDFEIVEELPGSLGGGSVFIARSR